MLARSFKPLPDLPYYKARVINPNKLQGEAKQVLDEFERESLDKFLLDSSEQGCRPYAGKHKR